jgi:hypothetical protein
VLSTGGVSNNTIPFLTLSVTDMLNANAVVASKNL